MVVVLEFRHRKEFNPVVLPFTNKEPEILFKLLVYSFRLPVHLRVVSGSQCRFDSEEAVELLGEFRRKLGAAIQNNPLREPMQLSYMIPEKACGTYCGDRSVHRNEVGTFGKEIHHYHDGIVPIGLREVNDKVNTYCVPPPIGDWSGIKMTHWWLAQYFGPKTEIAGRGVPANVPRHLWPPVIPTHQFQCLPPSGVTSQLTVMVKGYNLPTKIRSRRDIDLTAVV